VREKSFAIGKYVLIANGIYFFSALITLNFLHLSDKVWGNAIAFGFLLGVVSILLILFGKGMKKLPIFLVACGETFIWWFMAIGL
jgi:hypothetical protein